MTDQYRTVVRALALLTTQVKRIADHTAQTSFTLAPPVVTDTDDAPTTPEKEHRECQAELDSNTVARVQQLAEQWQYVADRKHGPREELLRALHTFPLATGPRSIAEYPGVDEDALRTARRDSLLVLLSRAARGTLAPEDGDLLRQHVEDEIRESNTARAVAAGNLRHVQVMYAELTATQAAIERVRTLVAGIAHPTSAGITEYDRGRHEMAAAVVLAITEQPAEGS
jgi:hypothetical protein